MVKSLPSDNLLQWPRLKVLAVVRFVENRIENIVRKGESSVISEIWHAWSQNSNIYTYLVNVHGFPNLCHNSNSFDVRQFSSNCLASNSKRGATASPPRSLLL